MFYLKLFDRYLICIAPRYGYIEMYDLGTGAKTSDAALQSPDVIWAWRWKKH